MHRDISGHVAALKAALEADDEKTGMGVGLALLAGALNDLRRIAEAGLTSVFGRRCDQ